MNEDEKVLSLLGMTMRAGKLVTGEELSLKEIRKKQARLVFIASDASENTRKKISDKCKYYSIPYITKFSRAELSQAIGKDRTICTVMDAGFVKRFRELLSIK